MYTCAVCGVKNPTLLCSNCGFDSSCDYIHYPTLQPLSAQVDAISHHRAQWVAANATRSVAQSMDALRKHGWSENVLAAVEKILQDASTAATILTPAVQQQPKQDPTIPALLLSRFCDNCGASNRSNAIYCTDCGKKMQIAAPSKIPQEKPKATTEKDTLILSKFCKHCGSNVTKGTIYCPTCSSRIE